jgi:hypothetical protein
MTLEWRRADGHVANGIGPTVTDPAEAKPDTPVKTLSKPARGT